MRRRGCLNKRILDRLLGLGMPDVALSLMRCQEKQELVPGDPVPLAWTRSLITVCVACGNYTLAYLEVRSLLASSVFCFRLQPLHSLCLPFMPRFRAKFALP